MHRSIQLQVLSWLAALASLGAATKPTFDTILFATAFVFGTVLMHVRERLERLDAPRAPNDASRTASLRVFGRLAGVAIAWGFVAVRHFTVIGARFPARLSTAMLIAAAVVPTGIVLVEGALSIVSRRRAARADAQRSDA